MNIDDLIQKQLTRHCHKLFEEAMEEICRTGETGIRVFYTKPPYKQIELRLEQVDD